MAFVINDGCVSCGACEAQCPVGRSAWVKASSKSTRVNASTAVPAQVPVLPVPSHRANSPVKESKQTHFPRRDEEIRT